MCSADMSTENDAASEVCAICIICIYIWAFSLLLLLLSVIWFSRNLLESEPCNQLSSFDDGLLSVLKWTPVWWTNYVHKQENEAGFLLLLLEFLGGLFVWFCVCVFLFEEHLFLLEKIMINSWMVLENDIQVYRVRICRSPKQIPN